MSKNKDKKPKEVKEETKAPSAEVSENGAEVEAEEGKEEIKVEESKPSAGLMMLAVEGFVAQASGLLSAIEVDPDHHNHLVICLTIDEAIKALSEASTRLQFIDKALSEKKK